MIHYHAVSWSYDNETLVWKPETPSFIKPPGAFMVCNNPLRYLDHTQNWTGDSYNPDRALCICAKPLMEARL